MLKKSICKKSNVPLALYKKILDIMPIFCVDVIFKYKSSIFLFKRAYEPAKDEWWFIGGRVLRGEKIKDAVIRKVKEEAGVKAKIKKMVGVYEIIFPVNRFDARKKMVGTHSICCCFLVEPAAKKFSFKLNEEYTGYKAIKKVDKSLHPYIKKALRDSGFR